MDHARSVASRKILLRDIAELQQRPYPNIRLHMHDDDFTTACLILTPENWKGLHLTVRFGSDYPLRAPEITIQSKISHPNVFGGYICASILNTEEDYTPAYTFKGIAIQLLSFFSSDRLEQSSGYVKDLRDYRSAPQDSRQKVPKFSCEKCGFGCRGKVAGAPMSTAVTTGTELPAGSTSSASALVARPSSIQRLADDVLLLILEKLEYEELTMLARAWPRVSSMIKGYDLLRTRELQCYVLKLDYRAVQLGIGVSVFMNGRQGTVQSEFCLISRQAVYELGVRKSVYGIPFRTWLPLPISYGHWRKVQEHVPTSLRSIAEAARFSDPGLGLYGFMNDIVVRLNLEFDKTHTERHLSLTLRHASERAIESYFHVFHLLLCIVTSPMGEGMVPAANRMVESFMAGNTSKTHVPNLGYLLIALLISDVVVTESLIRAIITEAITRNVVWLLDRKGAGMADLAYLEADEVSDYRLKKTFEGNRTSYRLLMFSELFRRTARPSISQSTQAAPQPPLPSPPPPPALSTPPRTYSSVVSLPRPEPPSRPGNKASLAQLRDELFARHGAPPAGAAARLAAETRRLQTIDSFPDFLREMGITNMPGKRDFTRLLRAAVGTSMERGYSKAAVSQQAALALRLEKDKSLDRDLLAGQMDRWGVRELPDPAPVRRDLAARKITFFPGKAKADRPARR